MDLPLQRKARKPRRKERPGKNPLKVRDHELQAQFIARRLRVLAEGEIGDPETWQSLARRLRVRYVRADCMTGIYSRPGWDSYRASIAISIYASDDQECRYAVHELAHHLTYESQGYFFAEETIVHRYDDENGGIGHRIACRVERLVLG
jgi:hypothetical protein